MGQFSEFKSHDGSTTFLLLYDHVSLEENFWRVYAIEAPKEWPLRHSFEHGEMSWSDFFQARGWIAELTGDFEQNSDTHCRYIEFSDLSANVKKEFKELDASGSPYQMLHDHTLYLWKRLLDWGHDPSEYQKKYENLIKNHGHRLIGNKLPAKRQQVESVLNFTRRVS
jgi:hypothetical protein